MNHHILCIYKYISIYEVSQTYRSSETETTVKSVNMKYHLLLLLIFLYVIYEGLAASLPQQALVISY